MSSDPPIPPIDDDDFGGGFRPASRPSNSTPVSPTPAPRPSQSKPDILTSRASVTSPGGGTTIAPRKKKHHLRDGFLLLLAVGLFFGAGYGVMHLFKQTGGGSAEPTASPTSCVRVKPKDVTVNVLNASGVTGAARAAADKLSGYKFEIATVGNDKENTSEVGFIRYSPDSRQDASLLALYIPGAAVVEKPGSSGAIDLALGKGFDGFVKPTKREIRQVWGC